MKPLAISVTKLVSTVLRSGDIDSRYSEPDAMQRGGAAHRRLQKAEDGRYEVEVPLKLITEIAGTPVLLQGRCDGILHEDGKIIIDEIKSTTLPLEVLGKQLETHRGQALCYAYMLTQTREDAANADKITVQVTYYQLETEELRRERREYTRDELEIFFAGLIAGYGEWMRYERDWRELRDTSVKGCDFPFERYRAGQRELAVAAYKTVAAGTRLYAGAPTGIGKTISTLFPSIKAIGEGKAEKIFYLTAKTVTRAVAEDSLRLLLDRGLRFKSVTLRAKDKICFCPEPVCNPESCACARGHYDRANAALLDILDNNDLITPDIIERYSRKHSVCPHETSLDIALWSDLVIGDYNHVFDPRAYLRRFFAGGGGEYVFLIDEAHNLADRVRDMHTCELNKRSFYAIKRDLRGKSPEARQLRKAAAEVSNFFINLRRSLEEEAAGSSSGSLNGEGWEEPDIADAADIPPWGDVPVRSDMPDSLITEKCVLSGREALKITKVSGRRSGELENLLTGFVTAAGGWLSKERFTANPQNEAVLSLFFEVNAYLGIAELFDERFAAITETLGGEVTSTLFCLDPSHIIDCSLGRARSSILFSATLTPLSYYKELLGGREEDRAVAFPSPFDRENFLLAAHFGISTRYADRERSLQAVSDAIYSVVSAKKGNYMVFFPSYEYMRKTYVDFVTAHPDFDTLLQNSIMDEEERAEFLRRFDGRNSETLVGFCILGGIFSEGIDLKGDRLSGAVIVGVGLPKINLRSDLIRSYFNRRNGKGYDYAYVFPGMNKVLQAAGRVIRSESDKGVAMLIDSRFATEKYRSLYPGHWSGIKYVQSTGEFSKLIGN
ncbi:MAG: PD-(D/E)XK nuclease family protein [Oscillospiraceae bacterium]|jgi:Rad3-related DNA helicase|nr:PD-(D/E)XK nuclease family protein [Oscillospiraceae bacterium]